MLSDYKKLEYIHHQIQEAINILNPTNYTIDLEKALEFVEDIREPYLKSEV